MGLTQSEGTVKAAKIGAAALIVAALIAGFFTFGGGDGGTQTDAKDSCGTTVGGQGAQGDSTVNCGGEQREPDHDFTGTKAPTGTGPWPYVVYKTVVDGNDEGLFVRSCPEEQGCYRTGHVFKSDVLWAVCQRKNVGFRGGYNDVEDTWLQVKWPTTKEWATGGPRLASSPDDGRTGWVFAYFVSPREHTGDIPECA